MPAASSGRAAALNATIGCASNAPGATASTIAPASSPVSRSSVSTSSDENSPIASSPAQATRSASGWRRMPRESSPHGMSSARHSSTTASATAAAGANRHSGGSSRQPM